MSVLRVLPPATDVVVTGSTTVVGVAGSTTVVVAGRAGSSTGST